MNREYRVFAASTDYPEGKMYYPGTMHEIDKNRGLVMNQYGELIHTRFQNDFEQSSYTMIWARIGFNVEEVMFSLGRKDVRGKNIWQSDIVKINGGPNDGRIGVVAWNDESSSYIVTGNFLFSYMDSDYTFEVLGNKYEHKHLLVGEQD